MTFPDAIRTCFRKYVTFSGRATRPEYWWFVLFLFLGQLVAGVIDGALFGTVTTESRIGDGQVSFRAENNGGPVGAIFGLVTFLPLLAAGWRRMHDSGRSGLHLLYPLIVMVGMMTFAGLIGALPGIGSDVTATQGIGAAILIVGLIVFILSPLIVIWWLTRPTQPEDNQYGPVPLRVPA